MASRDYRRCSSAHALTDAILQWRNAQCNYTTWHRALQTADTVRQIDRQTDRRTNRRTHRRTAVASNSPTGSLRHADITCILSCDIMVTSDRCAARHVTSRDGQLSTHAHTHTRSRARRRLKGSNKSIIALHRKSISECRT